MSSDSPIRVGVIGVGRGQSFMRQAALTGMQLVAICDVWEEKLREVGQSLLVTTYTDYDRFLEHDMDAVVLANYCHQHAPFAIKALRAGKHVLSECMPSSTMAESVALCRAVEASGRVYMLAENYPYNAANHELRRLYAAGEIGRVTYAEGEYQHAGEEGWRASISPGLKHWRNWLPPTYYCTHALAPLMVITDTMPVSVNALSIVEEPVQSPHTTRVSDAGFVLLCRMANGAVFRLLGLMLSSIHRVRYEIHGERGLIGTAEQDGWGMVKVHHESWLRGEGQLRDQVYRPEWPGHADLAAKSGHGGGDFWTCLYFADAIRTGQQPFLDVYRATAMSSVAIQGWRSALEEGNRYPIPELRDEAVRIRYQDDHWCPYPDVAPDALPKPPPSIRGHIPPGAEAIAKARAIWGDRHLAE